jgi:hypothetical protein
MTDIQTRGGLSSEDLATLLESRAASPRRST